MDKETFIQNLARMRKQRALLMRVSMSVLFVALVGSMWMTKAQVSGTTRLLFKAASTLAVGGVVYACVMAYQRLNRKLGMYCPHCDRSLSGPYGHRVIADQTCFHCGERLF